MSWAIWITGLPGSGKSVLARGAAARLEALGAPAMVLELDRIRRVLTPAPTYSATERDIVYRALAYMATALADAGVPVIIDATGHRREWRDLARTAIARFAEVQLVCPLDVCRTRERARTSGNAPRGIYAHAGRPGAAVPGVDVPYEEARAPELTIDTATEDPDAAIARIVALAQVLGAEPPVPETGRARRWAIWITGLPGSGKTTIAWSAAEALAARGVVVRVLGLEELGRALLGRRPESAAARDIVHRALVYTAKLLAEAGVAVIVDATAPRRAWRELARDLIARFAEVQLVCPPEVCGTRERATRWGLAEGRHRRVASAVATAAPEIVLDYEPALHPDLVLHTDVQDVWSAVEDVLRLANRLHGRESR
jgi:adenylylsulfate kinase